MQSKLNCRHMDEEKPNTIYCGETEGNKCVCKQENSLPSAVTDYKALKRKWGTVVNKTLQHLPEANYVLESQKRWKHYDTVRMSQQKATVDTLRNLQESSSHTTFTEHYGNKILENTAGCFWEWLFTIRLFGMKPNKRCFLTFQSLEEDPDWTQNYSPHCQCTCFTIPSLSGWPIYLIHPLHNNTA